MANKTVHLPVVPLEGLGGTLRKDNWWAGPAATVLVLSSFIVYATWRAFEGDAYTWALTCRRSTRLSSRWGGRARWGSDSSRRRCSFCRARRASDSLVITTERPTTGPSRGIPRVRGGRASAPQVQRRDQALHLPESAPLRDVRGRDFPCDLWKDALLAVFDWHDGVHVGIRDAGHAHQRDAPQRVHVRVPQLPAPHRRQREQLLERDARRAALPALEARERAQRAPHGLRVDSLFSVALTDLYIRMVATGTLTDVRLF